MIKTRDYSYPVNPMVQFSTYGSTNMRFQTNVPGLRGVYRYIDSPFTVGKFDPGTFRVNPVELRLWQCSCKEGRYSYSAPGDWTHNWYGQPLTEAIPWTQSMIFPLFPAALGPWSHTKALAKLNDTKFDVLTFIGELRETLWMLKNPLAAFQNYWANPKTVDLIRRLVQIKYRSPRASRRLRAARLSQKVDLIAGPIDVASGLWLQYRYGIMPLIYDLQGVIEMVMKKFDHDSSVLRAKRAGKRSVANKVVTGTLGYNNLYVPYKLDEYVTYKATTCVYYQLELMSDHMRNLRDLGLYTEHLPAVLWEVTKLSFVVDWFLNMGDFLQAIEPNPWVRLLGGCTSEKTTVVRTVRQNGPATVSGYTKLAKTLMTPEVSFTGRRLVRRTPIALPASPVFNVSTLSVKRAIDALALLWMGASSKLRTAQKQSMK